MQPDRIGRYRLDRLLATQATCETHAGWDEQLDRQVLVARVPLEGVDTAERELWRRDVRALSGVTHPGLVHVLDILHQDGCDWVVSEWVEGEPVDVLAARQPLAGCEVARLGAELAETLAALHQHAVRHGDVRPANVLVTSGGHVKLGGGCTPAWKSGEASEPPWTEPAPGGTARLAADLRGLGEVLLSAAGAQPSGSRTPGSTTALLAATCGELAAPLASVVSRCFGTSSEPPFESAQQAAAALRALDALSHDTTVTERPQARPASRRRLVAIALGASVLVVAGGVAAWRWLSPRRPLAVAVLPVDAPKDSEEARLAALAVDDTITLSLAALPGLVLVDGREVKALRAQDSSDEEIARRLAVNEIVEIQLARVASAPGAVIELTRRRARDGRVEWTRQLQASSWEPALVRELVGELLTGAYRNVYRSAQVRFSKASPAAVRTYVTLIERYRTGRTSPERKEELALLRAALEESPEFTEAWVLLTSFLAGNYARSLEEVDRVSYEHARDRALSLGGEPSAIGKIDAWVRVQVGDALGALELAQRLVQQAPGNPQVWQGLGEALSMAGRFVEAEAAFARSMRLHPSEEALATLARSRSDRGDHAGARSAVAELRSLAGNRDLLAWTEALIEMYAGNHAAAERLFRELSASRGLEQDFNGLGFCLYYQGRLVEAAGAFGRAHELDPRGYLAARNLADAHMALGDREAAYALYKEALGIIQPQLARGIAPRPVLETQAVCLAQLGRRPEAAQATDAMLKANPHHPETVFTAALVAAVSGERASALAWTRRALELHAPALWFQAPEFGPLRRDPEFARLLGSHS